MAPNRSKRTGTGGRGKWLKLLAAAALPFEGMVANGAQEVDAAVFAYPVAITAGRVAHLAEERFPLVTVATGQAVSRITIEYSKASNSDGRVLLPRYDEATNTLEAWVYVPKHSRLEAVLRGFADVPQLDAAADEALLERIRERVSSAEPEFDEPAGAHYAGLVVFALGLASLSSVAAVFGWRRLGRRSSEMARLHKTLEADVRALGTAPAVRDEGNSSAPGQIGFLLREIRVERVRGESDARQLKGRTSRTLVGRLNFRSQLKPGSYAVLSDGEREAWARLTDGSAVLLTRMLAAFPDKVDRYPPGANGLPQEGGGGTEINAMAISRARQEIAGAAGALIASQLVVTSKSKDCSDAMNGDAGDDDGGADVERRNPRVGRGAAADHNCADALGSLFGAALVRLEGSKVGLSPHLYVPAQDSKASADLD